MDIRTDADDEGGIPPTHPPPILPELEASVAYPKGDPSTCLRQGPRRAQGKSDGDATKFEKCQFGDTSLKKESRTYTRTWLAREPGITRRSG